ncbi:hypothetical protein HIJ39_13970 [Sulfobacillus sp. DSM 109850]|uniref:ClpX-type ZB domain-containing protein n=1 Tax=Sulfobacillus harzensis TaxID=2729629 RepID=A0A7Y0Q4P5_9FIRM|nr:hypothetical protein [Sulfobacillus harzensis]
MIAGANAYICDECVAWCSEIRQEHQRDGLLESDRSAVMVCGMVHFTWRQDWRSVDVGDVRSDGREREIYDVVDRLAAFRATHVAVEQIYDTTVTARYQKFLSADIELGTSEVEQIGFRLARKLGHDQIHPIDWMGSIPGQRAYSEVLEWAGSHQPALYKELTTAAASGIAEVENQSLLELLRAANREVLDRQSQARYLRLAQIGEGADYVGLDWLTWWYRRNLTLYVNITRLAEQPGARVLVLIGAGHRFLLHQFLRDCRRYQVVDVQPYLL